MNSFEYKSYLKINLPKHNNIIGLSENRFELTHCEYDFKQTINNVGEVNSRVKGGIINLTITDLPSDALMAWVFDHAKKYNGEITIFDTDGETREQVYFEKARCVDFNLQYSATEKPYQSTKLILIVEKIQIGNTHFENLKQ